MLIKLGGLLCSAVLLCCSISKAGALEFPTRVVRIIVPYAPGGSAEAQARTLAEELSKIWKQQVIVEDKPGAGTTIGAAYVASSPPDGYTLYLAGTSHTIAPSLYNSVRYDAVKSFSPISRVATSPFILMVNPSLGVNSVADFLALARAKPGKLNYGTSGIGAGPHLATEMLVAATKIDVRHVPFKGSAPAMTALLGNFVEFGMGDMSALPSIKAGSLQALAVTTAKRSSQLPDVPTFDEAIQRGLEVTNWSSILAPANTPPELINFINGSIAAALQSPDLKKSYEAQGFEPAPSTPDELRDFMTAEVKKYRDLVEQAGIQAE
ncbi:tripartite tricarboxylate transporter substrate binding protein [Bradyrhizobium sp. dw_78]|uniref:Bug family tripartite tricarboxylate transporter substrate binding protein n=1 Tax=Bradyrhizobium sp. dw_78 TaxID=2719793 RepID=UPI001BD298DF|nr:tripartite tricarboxylate transporter substrate binding protein [Bradyrhizobium sp. dw_78]